ncbi:hypothetical protein ACE6H2_007061 [Prunus campanulata]
MGVDDFFNPHGGSTTDSFSHSQPTIAFDPEPDLESRSYFDDLDPDPDYDFDSKHDSDDDPDPDPDFDYDPNPEFVFDSDPDPDFDFDFGLDSSSDHDPNSYCILCIFRCTNYDFPTNDPDIWTRLLKLW